MKKNLTTSWAGGAALLGAAVGMVLGVYILFQGQQDNAVRLPLLAIGGVIALLVIIALVAGAYTLFGLSDPTEALGLPEGSVRAIIALSLIVLFAILTIYLYSDVSHPPVSSLAGLSQAELDKFLLNVPTVKVIAAVNTAQPGGAPQFTVYYHGGSIAGEDFAKQLLVMIGTLMTSVTSFYFATKSPGGTSNTSNTSSRLAAPAPEPTGVTPREGDRGTTLSLDITGNNLGEITAVKLLLGTRELPATGVVASAGLVKCSVKLPADMETGSWTVKIADKSGQSAALEDAITIL